jgi:predicted DNA-binding transcriptional regulator YafY
MEALSAAGVPVFALRGAQGGWQLDQDWRTQVPGLDEDELRALLMAQPRVLGDAKLSAAADRALGKLTAALPAWLRDRATSIRQRLHVDITGWRGTTENLKMLPVVQDAVARDRKLAIQYLGADAKRRERTVDPLGLVAKGTAWYLFANTPGGYRTYRVSRIEHAQILDLPSQRPANFDLPEQWRVSTEQFREAKPPYQATLRLARSVAGHVSMWTSTAPVVDAKSSQDSVTLRVQFEDEEHACFVVLGLAARAEVVSPESLRNRIVAELRNAYTTYGLR